MKSVFSRCAGNALNQRPTGPSEGVKGSSVPHRINRGALHKSRREGEKVAYEEPPY